MPSSLPALSPSQERSLLDALITSTLSLPDLAETLNLAIVDLLEHIASPDLQAKLTALEDAAAHTLRVAACFQLPKVLTALTACLKGHQAECARLETGTDPDSITHLNRERINLRKTATILLRLARFNPLDPTTPKRDTSAQGRAPARSGALGIPSHPSPKLPARPAPLNTPTTLHPSPKTPAPAAPSSRPPLAPTQISATPLPLTPLTSITSITDPTPRSPISALLRRAGTPLALAGPAP